MYQALDPVTLRSGAAAELGRVLAPDPVWGPRLRRLLGHLGGHWAWQLDRTLGDTPDGTEGRFHLLSRAGRPFAVAMTVERVGIGILGHVFTAPRERRQGAANLLHRSLLADFRERGGRALSLRTGFDTPAYRMYRKHGFVDACPRSGSMVLHPHGQEALEREVLAPGPCTLEPLGFRHWPLLPLLTGCRHPARDRIPGMDAVNGTSPEEGALAYLVALARGRKSHDAVVAVSCGSQVPVGLAALAPAEHLGAFTDQVDVFAAPGHEDCLDGLLAALRVMSGRRPVGFAEPAWPAKASALIRAGVEVRDRGGARSC